MDEFSGYDGIILELPLVIHASAARLLLDLEVEPPFGNLLVLSSSFHEFLGRKWNKVTSSLLRPLVYEPVRRITKQGWGIMHELMVFYIIRKQPCGRQLVFFMLQGVGTSVEIYWRRSLNGKWRFNRLASQLILPISFISLSFYLIQPSLEKVRVDLMVGEEIANLTKLLKDVLVS
ncbi:acyl-CoA--sterol O-acyltransferase 1-like [Papaver somniferum]|uniref:acyl-CoA--sterol O-acyltransferase 1-like n=1 Tax=Papaver somniferum TaxID=3469 RepID=UPI000E6FB64C|nr:acyl-CoA--sterol O-acyltransferase 1-like [Papaver somniferum]